MIASILLTTGRTEFIYLIVVFIIIGSVCYQKKTNWNPRNTVKILMIGITGLLSFFLIFTLAGFLTGKSQLMSAYDMISFYTGLSIPSLDFFLLNPPMDTPYIGYTTLFPVYGTLRRLGFDLPQVSVPYEFVTFNQTRGNVYTALRRYIQDYSIFGMLLIMLLLGALFAFFFNLVKKEKVPGVLLIAYATFCFPIFEMSIEDRFFTKIVSTTTVYQIIYIILFYYFFVIRSQRFRRVNRFNS